MVITGRLWFLVVVLLIAIILALTSTARADDAATSRAKVALALSGESARCSRVKAALCGCGNCGQAVAPMPRAKAAKPPCVCGAECKCKDGDCPGKCPVSAAQPQAADEIWLINGQYYRVPAGQRPAFGLPGANCPNGNCQPQRR